MGVSFDEWWHRMLGSEGLAGFWESLDDRVQDSICLMCLTVGIAALEDIAQCESPIEQLLGIAMIHAAHRKGLFVTGNFMFTPQAKVDTAAGEFRVDFLVFRRYGSQTMSLVVECDGHDYHERTKQQATRDKRRDRALKLAGYEVMRFTGSEIWADPRKCAEEVLEYFDALAARKQGD